MAGGTGGHVMPALSIATFLEERDVQVEWLGTEQGLEARLVPAAGITLNKISIVGLRGKSLLRKLMAPFLIARAVVQALIQIRRIKPDCVLGMGGFVTGPGGVAAWLLRKPLLIHEQNAIAGMTNMLLMPMATVIMEAFPGGFVRKCQLDANALSRRLARRADTVQVVGNPVRHQILALAENTQRHVRQQRPRLLILGGSLGAAAINTVIPKVLASWGDEPRPEVWHQCGEHLFADTIAAYEQAGVTLDLSVRVDRFIDDMAAAYAWADLVICRAGALTVAELSVAGLASVLVPYPHAVDDHQTANARYLADGGAAVLLPQGALSPERVLRILLELMSTPQKLSQMSAKARRLATPEATELVGKFCLGACHGR